MMDFFLDILPPTTTAQQRKAYIGQDRKIHFYEPPDLKTARGKYMTFLKRYKPPKPFTEPVALTIRWYFPTKIKSRDGKLKHTRPDLDNMAKLFQDCLTKTGFWQDDAQVVRLVLEKRWSMDSPGIAVEIFEMTENGS
jgi:Holliday junction resolvase RusA-like endonuclease